MRLPADEAKPSLVVLLNGQSGSPFDVERHGGVGATSPPYLKSARDAFGRKRSRAVKFRVPAAFDQHGAGVVDPIELATMAEPAGLDLNAMAHDTYLVVSRVHDGLHQTRDTQQLTTAAIRTYAAGFVVRDRRIDVPARHQRQRRPGGREKRSNRLKLHPGFSPQSGEKPSFINVG